MAYLKKFFFIDKNMITFRKTRRVIPMKYLSVFVIFFSLMFALGDASAAACRCARGYVGVDVDCASSCHKKVKAPDSCEFDYCVPKECASRCA